MIITIIMMILLKRAHALSSFALSREAPKGHERMSERWGFRDVVFEDVVFDNNSSVTPY